MTLILDLGNGHIRLQHFTPQSIIHDDGPGKMIRISDEGKQHYFNASYVIAMLPKDSWR